MIPFYVSFWEWMGRHKKENLFECLFTAVVQSAPSLCPVPDDKDVEDCTLEQLTLE